MITRKRYYGAAVVLAGLLVACGAHSPLPHSTTVASAGVAEKPLAPETSPTGDIPDSQVFVRWTDRETRASFEVPEGFSRSINEAVTRFVSKLDGVSVAFKRIDSHQTLDSTAQNVVKDILAHARAVTVESTETVSAGSAIIIHFQSNSEPDPVTNKQVRLENEAVIQTHNGLRAVLTFWAPVGADNVDQWDRMAKSFRWGKP